jgi:hypothetical protein
MENRSQTRKVISHCEIYLFLLILSSFQYDDDVTKMLFNKKKIPLHKQHIPMV